MQHSQIVTATLQAAALSTISNICAQYIVAQHQKSSSTWFQTQETRTRFSLDFAQLFRFIALTLITAPPNWHWQQYLERKFPAYPLTRRLPFVTDLEKGDEKGPLKEGRAEPIHTTPGKKLDLRNTFSKWFIDCITAGTVMNTLGFLIIMGVLKGQAMSQIWYNIKTQMIHIIIMGYKIWPIASIISFSFIPVHRRVVFLSGVGLLWGIYMSLVAARV